jgi:endogenous inhibitor of DNA gyrase (YacG/DUF329 family)
MSRCPICDKEVKARARNEVFPFCSQRCKTVDLGKWLNEDYRIPAEDAPDDEPDNGAGKKDTRH